jgi:multidrug efflux pump subunit AcrB
MPGFNLSALAVRERAITLFFIFASACAGFYAYLHLGRAEDPYFTINVAPERREWRGAPAK